MTEPAGNAGPHASAAGRPDAPCGVTARPNRRADDAVLQDALVSLERSRRKETQARAAAETLIDAMHRLVQAVTAQEIHDAVLSAFLQVSRASDAAILALDAGGALQAVAQTCAPPPIRCRAPAGPILRAIDGKAALIGDTARAPAWRAVEGLPAGAASAILTPLPEIGRSALLLGLHPARNHFSHDDLAAARAFAPVATEAFMRARHIEEHDRLVARLNAMANHDSLTGLYNRQRFLEALRERDRSGDGCAKRYALLHLDLDGFKAVNDSLGHAAGDAILKVTAARLLEATREDDTCARLGGDEFAMILGSLEAGDDPTDRAETILRAVSRPVPFEGRALSIGASIGMAVAPDDAADSDGALRAADVALVMAKTSGRGRLCRFEIAMQQELTRRRLIEARLQTAIARDEFALHYQPVYDVRQRRVVGFEALLRWTNPCLGPISPPDFLRIAADSGLMPQIGAWVMRRACEETAPWLEARPGRRLAINVSSAQLIAPYFVSEARQITREFGLDPTMIELELSEEIVIQRTAETALDNLTSLYAAGFQIAFDDFGTGYSSLQHLRRFPGQRLKIDRSFIAPIDRTEADFGLVRGLTELAGALDLSVVAEGVETAAQFERCVAAGCAEIQGFLIARPQPFADAAARAEAIDYQAAPDLTALMR